MNNQQILHAADTPHVEPDNLIPIAEAGRMLGLSADTIRKRGGDTEDLTIVRQGRLLYCVSSEVVAHRRKLIDNARRRTDVLRLVKNG